MQLGLGVSSDFVFVMQGLVLFLMSFHLARGAAAMSAASSTSSASVFSAGVLASGIRLAVPTALAAIGEAVSQRAGHLQPRPRGDDDGGRVRGLRGHELERQRRAGPRLRRPRRRRAGLADGARQRRLRDEHDRDGVLARAARAGARELPLRRPPGRAAVVPAARRDRPRAAARHPAARRDGLRPERALPAHARARARRRRPARAHALRARGRRQRQRSRGRQSPRA